MSQPSGAAGSGPRPGCWPSPITADALTASAIRISQPRVLRAVAGRDGRGGLEPILFHAEQRPSEQGRVQLVQTTQLPTTHGTCTFQSMLPAGFDMRTRVHEYGGAAYAVCKTFAVFSNYADNAVYLLPLADTGAVRRISPPSASQLRFADFHIHPSHGFVLAVCEDTTIDRPDAVKNRIVVFDLRPEGRMHVLAEGNDFYTFPRWNSTGDRVCFVSWNHPNMPWTDSRLYFGVWEESAGSAAGDNADTAGWQPRLTHLREVPSGTEPQQRHSVSQPRWHPTLHDKLYFVCDSTGYRNLYVYTDARGAGVQAETPHLLVDEPIPCSVGGVDFSLGKQSYAFDRTGDLMVVAYKASDGSQRLAKVDMAKEASADYCYPGRQGHRKQNLSMPFLHIDDVGGIVDSRDHTDRQLIVVTASSSYAGKSGLWTYDLSTGAVDLLKAESTAAVASSYLPTPQALAVPLSADAEALSDWDNGAPQPDKTVFGWYYAPSNPSQRLWQKPPLLVDVHGGPTAFAAPSQKLTTAYWTSRGWAVLAPNYGGSDGYGRAYMERLDGAWGEVDVEDVVRLVQHLISQDVVDPDRICIRGGSAGGYTVLRALTYPDAKVRGLFAAGCSLYGISDLVRLAADTHKFESQYLFRLVGGTPASVPEVYAERSPLGVSRDGVCGVTRLSAPLLLLQGADDRVVPREQSEAMQKAAPRNVPVSLIVFPHEGHGFVMAEHIRQAFETELAFYETHVLKGE